MWPFGKKKEKVPDEILERLKRWEKYPVPDEIMQELKGWHWRARYLRIAHVLIGLIATISSVTVASRLIETVASQVIKPYDEVIRTGIPWLAAISIAILTSMGLEAKSNNMRCAWRILNTAVLKYQNEKEFTMEKLIEAYKTGEETIGDVTIALSKPSKPGG